MYNHHEGTRMKTVNYLLKTDTISDTVDIVHYRTQAHLLIQVFCGQGKKKLQTTLNELQKLLPHATCIGTTTDGEIEGRNIYTQQTVLAFSSFKHTTLKAASVNSGDSYKNGVTLAKSLLMPNTKLLLVFTDGTSSNGEAFLKGIESVNNSIIVAGGMAGDNAQFMQTYIANGTTILEQGAVGVSLNSEILKVHNNYSFNWNPIGVSHAIDKVVENRVYRIDGMTPVSFYAKYLGDDVADALPTTGIEFPLIIEKNGLQIARAVLAKHSDGSLSFAGNLHNGDRVKLGFGNAEMILLNPQNAVENFCDTPVESFFIYSCMARRRYIPDFIQIEIEPFAKLADVSGFFTYAEFYHHHGHNELFNQTLTAVALSESTAYTKIKACKEREEERPSSNEYTSTIQALTHLIQQSTDDLKAHARKLDKERQFSQKLLHNQKLFMRHAIHETMTPLSVIMNNIELYNMKHEKNAQLSKIEAAMKHMYTIYDDLSYMVKQNQVPYPYQDINLLDFLKNRMQFFEEVAAQSHLSFKLHSNTKDAIIYFNETKLQRIIDNNITNAIKYTQEHESITLSITRKEDTLILSFASKSICIQEPQKVFDAYYRENTLQEGFGLGLNLVKQICDNENIEITLHSSEERTQFSYLFKKANI